MSSLQSESIQDIIYHLKNAQCQGQLRGMSIGIQTAIELLEVLEIEK